MTPNGGVLLQAGDFIMSCLQLQFDFILKVEDNILLLGFVRQPKLLLIANYSRLL
jgi:hypothetical protein